MHVRERSGAMRRAHSHLMPAGRSSGRSGSASTREPALPWQNTTHGKGFERGRKREPQDCTESRLSCSSGSAYSSSSSSSAGWKWEHLSMCPRAFMSCVFATGVRAAARRAGRQETRGGRRARKDRNVERLTKAWTSTDTTEAGVSKGASAAVEVSHRHPCHTQARWQGGGVE